MPSKPQDLYNPVPSVSPETATPGDYLTTHASPENFGAQVGASLEKAGGTLENTGIQAIDYAKFQQGIANETAVTSADAAFAMKVGKIKGDYMTTTGSAAYAAFPQYQKDIQSAFQEQRAILPLGAQRSFDMLAARSMANHIADGSSYAASQLKEGLRDSYSQHAVAEMTKASDPNIAADDARFGEVVGNLRHDSQASIDYDHPGLATDPQTGQVSFAGNDMGDNLKASVQQRTDAYLTQAYVNRYQTLMKGDVVGAFNKYQDDRKDMPDGAKVMLDATFGQKIFDKHTQDATGNALQDGFQAHWGMLTDPHQQRSSNISDAIFSQESGEKFGNQTSIDGAIGGAQIIPATFAQYAKPGEDINNPDDNRAVGQRIVDHYTKEYNGDASRVAVAYFSGPGNVASAGSANPWINDTKDGNGKSVSSYVSDVTAKTGNAPLKSYATGETGSPMTNADYYLAHRGQILQWGDQYAEKQMPGDLALKRSVRQSLNNFMEATIQNQHAQYSLDNKNMMQILTGGGDDSKAPQTEAQLRQDPKNAVLLDRVAYQDPKFYEQIPTIMAKINSRHTTVNSLNGYDTIQRTLEPNDGFHPNGIFSQDHLDRLLGRSDGTGINMKDYKDAKQAIEVDDKFKEFLRTNMAQIKDANGNVDGMGQQRAVDFYNSAMALYNQKLKDGKPVANMVNPQSSDYINVAGTYQPSRTEQIANSAKGKQAVVATFVTPDDPAFAKLPPGTHFMTPEGERIKN